MHILVTNDDGIQAPGLLALAQAMRQIGEVTVVAPDRNWSASGHVKNARAADPRHRDAVGGWHCRIHV